MHAAEAALSYGILLFSSIEFGLSNLVLLLLNSVCVGILFMPEILYTECAEVRRNLCLSRFLDALALIDALLTVPGLEGNAFVLSVIRDGLILPIFEPR